MRKPELERKVLAIADRLDKKQPIEDSTVEVKADWIEPSKMARQLAGLCNAAHGDPVLWIVGLDEVRGTVGTANRELADWWPQVQAEFDRLSPNLVNNLAVPIGNHTVCALEFETDRAPFVTRNPAPNDKRGPVDWEVPWREGNRVRSARREDLVRLLVPLAQTPTVEPISARATFVSPSQHQWFFDVTLSVFATVARETVIAAHQSTVSFEPAHMGPPPSARQKPAFVEMSSHGRQVRSAAKLLQVSDAFTFEFTGESQAIGPIYPPTLRVRVEFGITAVNARPSFIIEMHQTQPGDRTVVYEWQC